MIETCKTDPEPMSLVGFSAKNHPQQTRYAGSKRHVDDRALPQEVFDLLIQREFQLSIDVAASEKNAKLPRFWTESDDALGKSWAKERVYCNPPYSAIAPWISKAWDEVGSEIIVMLLPANRTEQKWWQNGIEPMRDKPGSPLRTQFLPGRLRFLKPGQQVVGPNERPPFGCVLCIWNHATQSAQSPHNG